MKTKDQIISEINNKLNAEYTKVDFMPRRESTSYNKYAKTWATVVAVDIVGFKKMVSLLSNEVMVKIIQLFNENVAHLAINEFKDIFRDIYYAGDEVIVVFAAKQKEKISRAVDFSFHINSIVNNVLAKQLMSSIPKLSSFSAGIGIWTSNDNTIVRSGLKSNEEYSNSTLIGSSINNACKLAKVANRGNYLEYNLLMNGITKINLVKTTKDSVEKWTTKLQLSIDGSNYVWGGSIVKTRYN